MSWRQVSDTIVSKTRGRAFEEERHTNGVVTENVLDPHRLSMPRLQFSPTKCNVAEDTDPLMQQNAMNPKRNGGEDWAEQTSLLANNTGAIKVVVTLFLSRSRRHGINLF
ncbi:uncharacterized protein LOC141703092 [Apium graveolens]|uniref:uncharacterized protein LOC141703092 n=1 Tax=Apium graveolens TaxID=4045 RepID=UPI003D7BF51D